MKNKIKKIITFTSDFGDDFAKGQVGLVIKSINPDAKFVTASNQVTPFSILEGAFILAKFSALSPTGSIHLAIVDPGVGSSRRGLILQTKDYFFIGPDNGLLFVAANQNNIQKVFVINEQKIGGFLSNTFHGRDIFAKVAANLSLNKDLLEFGNEIGINSLTKLEFAKNQVLHIDNYGNIKINNLCSDFKIGDTIKIECDGWNLKLPFVKTFADVKADEFLAYKGSHQILEIAQNLGSANKKISLSIGDIVKIERIPNE